MSAPALTLVAALLASGVAADEATQIVKAEGSLGGTASNEKNILALAGPRARHEKNSLVLVLDDGKSVRFANDSNCRPYEEDGCTVHSLAAFLPSRGVFLVQNVYYEAYEFVLIEMASGKQHTIDGPPHYSRDGKRFVTCRVDEMNGGGTRVWRIAPGRYVQEWADARMSVCGSWKDNDTFSIGVYAAEPSGTPRPLTLTHKGDAWQLR